MDRFTRDMIHEHNKHRMRHDAPPLSFNPQAAHAAQQWVEKLARTRRFDVDPEREFGENLFISDGQTTAKYVVDSWYNRIYYYDFQNPGSSPAAGTFSQVVWASTTSMGVGRTVSGSTTYVAVFYSPRGNVEGEFAENVKPPKN